MASLRSRHGSGPREWAAFDSLPPELRQVFARAPYNIPVVPRLGHLRKLERAGLPVSARRAWLILHMCKRLQTGARATYGADHPDARSPRGKGPAA